MKIITLFKITRLPNVITAVADILAGTFIVGVGPEHLNNLVFLCLASGCIYAGGVVQNDLVDVVQDTLERPDRPIPSGAISLQETYLLSASLLCLGMFFAAAAGQLSGLIAALLLTCVFVYNYWAKKHDITGSVVMGLCRALNLALGLSVLPELSGMYIPLCLFPFLHIAGITLLSKGENTGLKRSKMICPVLLLLLVFLGLFSLSVKVSAWYSLFIVIFYAAILSGELLKVLRQPTPYTVKGAIRKGILAISVLNASLTAIFSGWFAPLVIIALTFISWRLSRRIEMS